MLRVAEDLVQNWCIEITNWCTKFHQNAQIEVSDTQNLHDRQIYKLTGKMENKQICLRQKVYKKSWKKLKYS